VKALTSAAVVLLAHLCCGRALGSTSYFLTEIGHLPGGEWRSEAFGINNAGAVVGTSDTATLGERPFIWSSATGMQDLGQLSGGAGQGDARSINDAGAVTGHSSVRPYLWTQTEGMQPLTEQTNIWGSYGVGINKHGHIAVNSDDRTTGWRGLLWTPEGGMTDIGSLPGGRTRTIPRGINDAGQIVGTSDVSRTGYHAFRWEQSVGMRDLGDLPGGSDYSDALGINSSGHVVGWSFAADGQRAFAWTPETGMRDLGVLDGRSGSIGRSINAQGHVVGESDGRAFLWTPAAGMQDLNRLTRDASDWTLTTANAISDRGQIVGQGIHNGRRTAYLLTPVPSPRVFLVAVGSSDVNRLGIVSSDGQGDAEAIDSKFRQFTEFQDSRVVLYHYDEPSSTQPLESAIADIAGQVRPDDVFVFYYAGHGFGGADLDEGLDITRDTVLDDDTLTNWFSPGVWSGVNKLFIFDACHSGGFAGGLDPGAEMDLSALPRAAVLAATDESGQTGTANYLSSTPARGLFTLQLEKALTLTDGHAAADLNTDGLTFDELTVYLHSEMSSLGSYQGFIRDDKYADDLGEQLFQARVSSWSAGDFQISVPEPRSALILFALWVRTGRRRRP
jgi:probable HAF family extracellular repeat protein